MNFKVKDEGVEKTGYLKISSEGKVSIFYSDGEKIFDPEVQIDVPVRGIHFLNIESFSRWAERHELEIIPRDPETYTDWKVGDEVIDNAGDAICIIIARLGEVVFIKNQYEKIKTLTSAWVDANYKLIVTDYEQELLNIKEQDTCPFKIGDRVLVRAIMRRPGSSRHSTTTNAATNFRMSVSLNAITSASLITRKRGSC